jgi:aspartate kinase
VSRPVRVSAAAGIVTVIKIGGSVLTGIAAYRRAATFITQRLHEHSEERLVVVVSAEYGVTDALLATARDIVDEPDPATLDLLWSTGELRSAALLALQLQAQGVRAAAVNVHQTGLTEPDVYSGAGRIGVRSLRLVAALAKYDVVVAPGFLARGDGDAVVSLGRGGSDLTAVLLAAGLGAKQCELVKDVPGYFSADPNVDASAAHLPNVDFEEALAMADAGCDLVQRQALEVARDRRLPLVVRAIDSETRTVVN